MTDADARALRPNPSTPLEALMHQAEPVADMFDRLGRDTSDVERTYEIFEVLVCARK